MIEPTLVKYFLAVFAITNPFANLVVFVSLTGHRSSQEQHAIAIKTSLAIATIFLISTWLGNIILSFFAISVPSFELAGGTVLSLVALSMLQTHKTEMSFTSAENEEAATKNSIAVVPLAIPIFSGPGAISTIIVHVRNNPSILTKTYFSLIDIIIAAFIMLLLYFAAPISRFLGNSGSRILTRIMGLIILAMAFEMLVHGARESFPALAATSL